MNFACYLDQPSHLQMHAGIVMLIRPCVTSMIELLQDCTICLWTLSGERTGTFGEQTEWKLKPDMYRFEGALNEVRFVVCIRFSTKPLVQVASLECLLRVCA